MTTTTKPTPLELYTKGIEQREELITDIDQEITEVNLNIEEADKEIEARQETLLAEARSKYEALGVELAEKRNTLEAAKAVLSDKQAVLKELRGNTTTEEVYLEEDEVEAVPVSEDEEETIIDTPEESSIEVEKSVPISAQNKTKEEGFIATTLNIGGNYIIIEKPINSYQIGQIGKALKTIDREAALDIINNTLLDYLSDKQYQALKKRLGLEDIVVEEGPKESTAKVDGVYPCSTTSDDNRIYDPETGEELF